MRHKYPKPPNHTHEISVRLVFVSVSDTLFFFYYLLTIHHESNTVIGQGYEKLLLS